MNLSVDDLDRARRFYGELLGMRPIPRPNENPRAGAWYRVGDVEVHLSVEAGLDNARSKRHVAFEVRSVAEVRAAFKSAGLTVDEGHPLPGLQRVFVRDPSGNRLELYEVLMA